jgi:pimeloyl-ACP methyl ester carboxylesterase
MAELLRPGTFDSLVLIEPIILPPPFVAGDNPSAAAARKRRASFGSRAEARARLGQKPPFETWNELAFAGYIRDGLRSTGRGEEVALACDPKDEEEIYRTATAHGAWERLGEVAVPVLVMAGGRSDTHDEALIRAIANRFPSAGIEVVAGAGHFLPMERPELVAERIRRLQVVANSSTKPRARSPR